MLFKIHITLLSKQFVLIENQDKKQEKTLHFLVENPSVSNKTISKELQVALRTEQSVVKRFKDTGTIKRKSGSGRKKCFVRRILIKK